MIPQKINQLQKYLEAVNDRTIYIVNGQLFSDKETADLYYKLVKTNSELGGGSGQVSRSTATLDKVSKQYVEKELADIEASMEKMRNGKNK